MNNLISNKLLKSIIKVFDSLSLAATLTLLLIVAFNILARLIYNLTDGSISLMIPGSIELAKYTLLLIIFTALPHASISSIVRVDLISKHLPKTLAIFLDKTWLILMSLFCIILTWLFSQKAFLTYNRGDATQDLLMPLFYFYITITITCFATTLSCLIQVYLITKKIRLPS